MIRTETFVNKATRFGRDFAFRRVPIEALPPYGGKREQFARLLKSLPEGGIGFHGTSSTVIDSIKEYGIDPKFRGAMDRAYCIALDPATDPILQIDSSVRGTIATYHRVVNGLKEIMMNYAVPNQLPYREVLGIDAKPAIIVFSGVGSIGVSKYMNLHGEASLKNRTFYHPDENRWDILERHIDRLPVFTVPKVPAANIIEGVVLDINVDDYLSSEREVARILNNQADTIINRLIERYI